MSNWKNLVSAARLFNALKDNNIKIIDASWYMPQQNRNAWVEYLNSHIPGAVFFDIDKISDQNSKLPHMLPSETQFSEAASQLGIMNDHHIIVYDGIGLFSAARVWWTFKAFGHDKVSILQGGFPAWKRLDAPIETGPAEMIPTTYVARLISSKVVDWKTVLDMSEGKSAQIIDARSEDRFFGRAPEPRQGLKSGHIPGSCNIPFQKLIDNKYGLILKEQIRKLFEDCNIDFTRPIVTTCGSGVTAAILTLALDEIGYTESQLYDGSWAEWGCNPETRHKISQEEK